MSGDKKIYDAAIVGAGPAGSSLAIRLAMARMSVLLVEQKKFPRESSAANLSRPNA